VSFSNPTDLAAAIKEMNGLYLSYKTLGKKVIIVAS
jgi:hypothetical protein